jgi:hypothetical protein
MSPHAPTLDEVREVRARLAITPADGLEETLAELGELEGLKHAVEARQAALAAHVDRLMRARAAERGEPESRQGRGVGEAVAAARRISPWQGRVVLAMAKHLDRMPATMDRFRAGDLSEYKALTLTREAAVLEPHDTTAFDQQIAGLPGLAEMGHRKLAHRAQAIALRLDEDAAVRRRQQALEDRHVTVRPTDRGDGMAWLTALLPVEQAYAIKDALDQAADVVLAAGAATSRGQVMADTLVIRITEDNDDLGIREPSHPVTLNLIMTDTALLDLDNEPAILSGHGPLPSATGRRLIRLAENARQRVTLRRLYTHPTTGELVTMESRSRRFPKALSEFIRHRDQLCRTPGCGARIAHIDHRRDWADGGETTAANGQGLCAQCNWAYQVIRKPSTSAPPLGPRQTMFRGIRVDYFAA